MANRSHLSDTLKHETSELDTVEQDAFPSELVEEPVENAYVVVGASLPTSNYDTDEWKTSFPHLFPGCVTPMTPQSGSFLSQICEDMDPQKWSTGVGFEDVVPAQKLPVATQSKRSRSGEETGTNNEDNNELVLKREAEKEKNRERMRRLRASRDEEKIARDREKARERTRRVRASWDENRRQQERQRAREYMRRRRAEKAAENKQNARLFPVEECNTTKNANSEHNNGATLS